MISSSIPSESEATRCQLFRLPPELRLQIYELSLGHESIHIWTRPSKTQTSTSWPHKVRTWNTRHTANSELRTIHLRTGHAVCSNPNSFEEQYRQRRNRPGVDVQHQGSDSCIQACSSATFLDLTGVIFSCRKAYYEARFLPYQLFTFMFVNGFHAEFFFHHALSPAQRDRVRNIHFEAWKCQPDLQGLNPWADLALYREMSLSTVVMLKGLKRLTYRDLEFDAGGSCGILVFRELRLSNVKALVGSICDDKLNLDTVKASRLEEYLVGRENSNQEIHLPKEQLWCCDARCRDLWRPQDWILRTK